MSFLFTSSIFTSFIPSFVFNRDFVGVIVTKDFIASFVFSLLFESINLPNFIKYNTMQLDSKYRFST